MKKIGLLTNKVLAQSLSSVIRSKPDLALEPYALLNPEQALLDARIWQLDIAVVALERKPEKGAEAIAAFCRALRDTLPQCRILLLVSQDDKAAHDMAIGVIKNRLADDYVFYDSSLDYLFAKLAAF